MMQYCEKCRCSCNPSLMSRVSGICSKCLKGEESALHNYVNVPETKGHSPKLELPKEPVFKEYKSEHLGKPVGGVTNPRASGMINSLRSTVETLESELKAEKERTKALERGIDELKRFKKYFDELYGQNLGIANWHLNGEVEPFDNFYDSAIEATESDGEDA